MLFVNFTEQNIFIKESDTHTRIIAYISRNIVSKELLN